MTAEQYDEDEAKFHEFEATIDGHLLNVEFEKKLDSAMAAIPQPLREFLEALADDYDLDEIDKVFVLADEQGLCVDNDLPPDDPIQSGCFSDDEVRLAWSFIQYYRATKRLLIALDRQSCELLNPLPKTAAGDLYSWLAINGSGCAAAPMPLLDAVVDRPQPHGLLGYQSQEEQLRDQQFLLTLRMKEVANEPQTKGPGS